MASVPVPTDKDVTSNILEPRQVTDVHRFEAMFAINVDF